METDFKQGAKPIKWRLDNFFNKWFWDNWITVFKIKEAWIHMLLSHTDITSKFYHISK